MHLSGTDWVGSNCQSYSPAPVPQPATFVCVPALLSWAIAPCYRADTLRMAGRYSLDAARDLGQHKVVLWEPSGLPGVGSVGEALWPHLGETDT